MFEVNDLDSIIEKHIKDNQREMNTFIPAVVTKYDPETQTVDVQPSINVVVYSPPSEIELPELQGIPLIYPRSKNSYIHIPIEVGDNIGVIFSQRSLANWKEKGGSNISTTSSRMHDIADGVAIVGLDIGSNSNVIPDNSKLTISSTTGIWIGNPEGTAAQSVVAESELLQTLIAFMEQLKIPLVSSMGPVQFDPSVVTAFAEIEAVLKEISDGS